MTPPTLSIIIINWNTKDLLRDCVTSIEHNPPDCPYELLIVDNASTDGSQAMVREVFPRVILIENEKNVGFAPANNIALLRSTGEFCLFLNSDTIVPADALDEMVGFFRRDMRIGAVGPKLINPDGSFQGSYMPFPSLLGEILLVTRLAQVITGPYAPSPRPIPGEEPRKVDWVSGAALMVRRSALAQVGPFREEYFFYTEETDLCWRLHQAGWQTWYLPHVQITHYGGASSKKVSLKSYSQLYRSKFQYFHFNHGRITAEAFKWMLLFVVGLRCVLWKVMTLAGRQSFRDRFSRDQDLFRNISRFSSAEPVPAPYQPVNPGI